jgi:nucleotidyltransferase substrate binding protein (TIGR01987 family)
MQKVKFKLEKLRKALETLEAIYLKPNLEDRSNIDATIQRFEFTFELFWKVLKEFFYQKGLEVNYPKDVIKEAYADNLIQNESLWIQMLKDRNLTSHTYDETLANEIFKNIKNYVPVLREAFNKISAIILKS